MEELWQKKGLNSIQSFLSNLEKQKKVDAAADAAETRRLKMLAGETILNPHAFNKLSESNIWSRTKEEDKALIQFKYDMRNYEPRRTVQKRVLSFATDKVVKYLKLDFHTNALDEYIDKSNFWNKRTVQVTPNGKDTKIKVVFAENQQMRSVIFEYMKKMVVTTQSSFENYLKNIEGRHINSIESVFFTSTLPTKSEPSRPIYNQEDIEITKRSMDAVAKKVLNFNKKYGG